MTKAGTGNEADAMTEEVKAERRSASREARLRRQRTGQLRAIKDSLSNAQAALASGDLDEHAEWLAVAEDQFNAYGRALSLTVDNGATPHLTLVE